MSLAKFVAQQNVHNAIFGDPQIDVKTLTEEQAQALFKRLDSNMSPEALFADGERPRAKAMALAKMYREAWAGLIAKGFKPVGEFHNMV